MGCVRMRAFLASSALDSLIIVILGYCLDADLSCCHYLFDAALIMILSLALCRGDCVHPSVGLDGVFHLSMTVTKYFLIASLSLAPTR